jgi:RHS repeat-associated protein
VLSDFRLADVASRVARHNYRARYYDPTRQRFISEDPIGFRGGINVYAYAWNSPAIWRDPLGLDVIVAVYGCCGGMNHVGIGVNSFVTSGFYAASDGPATVMGLAVPGQVAFDHEQHPEGPITWIRIPTTQTQDAAIQAFIEARRNNPGPYQLYGRNCVSFVQAALAAGGVNTMPTIFPNHLSDQLTGSWPSIGGVFP